MTQATAKTIKPLGDRIVVKPQEREEVTRSGIVLPDTAKEKPQQGTVLAVGPGKVLDNGQRQPVELEEGQTVLFAKYAGTEFSLEDEDVLILRESDVLGVIS
ncbi:MAG: co-chaperone GroES [Chloroflexota bacterium]|nr:co-chaperone GroES [Chloroflexota bacterium]